MATNSKNIMVGRIHALWCGHCKALVPEWSKMKKELSKQRGGYKFVSVEQSKEEPHLERLNKYLKIDDNAKKVQIQGGYPTIFKASNGVVEYYNGPRMAENLVQWAKEPMKGGSYNATKRRNKSHDKNHNRSHKLSKSRTAAKSRRRHH